MALGKLPVSEPSTIAWSRGLMNCLSISYIQAIGFLIDIYLSKNTDKIILIIYIYILYIYISVCVCCVCVCVCSVF